MSTTNTPPEPGSSDARPPSAPLSRRYVQSKEQSAELLRLSLSRMGQHTAAFDPVCYTVWYEHLAGINPPLSRAIAAFEGGEARVDDDAALQLYQRHVAPHDAERMERVGADLQQLMHKLMASASQAGDRAGAFGAHLESLSDLLDQADTTVVAKKLPELARATAQVSESIRSLHDEVTSSREEITRLRGELDRTRAETMMDPLTGVLNRRGFDRALAELLSRHDAGPGFGQEPPCLLLFDIDHFKLVNDNHGHVVGDGVIQGLGQVLRKAAALQKCSAARYGGEEFAILLPKASRQEAARVAESIRLQAKAMKFRQRGSGELLLSITVSAGVAQRAAGEDAEALTARADAALYRAKREGRDRVLLA